MVNKFGYRQILNINQLLSLSLHECVLSCFTCVRLFAILWTIVGQAPLSTRFLRQEYWRGLPCCPPGDLPNPGIEPTHVSASLTSPALAGGFFTTTTTWKPFSSLHLTQIASSQPLMWESSLVTWSAIEHPLGLCLAYTKSKPITSNQSSIKDI